MKQAHSIDILKLIAISTIWCSFTIPSKSAQACGWWGDGEMIRHNDDGLKTLHGESVPQSLTQKTLKLPGRIGYGIAVPDPGLAIPYLQATHGRQINRIADLKVFGFETVIDLGTPKKKAQLHRMETEAVNMRYFNIPIDGLVPSQKQVNEFTETVIGASSDMLLVYAPNSALLGTMWAAYRINLGAPINFSIKQGKDLGMKEKQEAILLTRSKEK